MPMTPPAVSSSRPRRDPAAPRAVWQRYAEYLRRPPLLTIEWADSETPARGWLVINSLRGGAAGGGTRMRSGLTRREVTYLAKTMELKFAFSGPPIGGAKSGIHFDPADPRRPEVLRRWFRAVAPQLQCCYGTGGDLNVDELLDVIPGCAEVGVSHPQEGVVRGHLRPGMDSLPRILDWLDRGVKEPVQDALGIAGVPLQVADLVTGYGLARSIVHLYEAQGRSVEGARVVVEGFGAVGGPCALYLARAGARVVGVADFEKVLVEPRGLGPDEVEALLRHREGKLLPRAGRPYLGGAERDRLWCVPADIFVSAACSETIDTLALERLQRQGIETIACGANQPFREAMLGATRVQRLADRHFTVVPDIIANCGMARAFSYLMSDPRNPGPTPLFQAVDDTIHTALHDITELNHGRSTGLLGATLAYALDRLRTEASV